MQCVPCSRGPEGLEGHPELRLYIEDQPHYGAARGHHVFMCVGCATLWERYYEGGGAFIWSRQGSVGD